MDFIKAELTERIIEALNFDDRIISVEDFSFNYTEKHNLICSFTVNSIFGNFDMRKDVKI